MGKPKRIGVLTSGGDCAGLNAALRAVVLRAAGHYGWDVIGIRNGPAGLLQRPVDADILQLEPGLFDGTLLRRGGTILGPTNQGDPFDYPLARVRMVYRSADVLRGYPRLKPHAPHRHSRNGH